jgi:hypothetical protein
VSDQFSCPRTTAKYKSGLMDVCPPIFKDGAVFTCTTEGSIRLEIANQLLDLCALARLFYSTTATASISMRSLGSMRAETSTIEDAG